MIMAPTAMSAAPSYRVPKRKIVAVEHPMIIKNIDNGLKTFGPATSFAEVYAIHIPGSDVIDDDTGAESS